MRAGSLDRKIVVERYSLDGDDGYGNPAPQWAPWITVRAQIVQSSSEEFFLAGGLTEQVGILFRVRFVDSLSTADRIAYNGMLFNIKEVKEIGRRRGLEIRCVSSGRAP